MELDIQVSPEEIMSREVELDPQGSPEEIKRRKVELDPQVSREEIMSREVELDPRPRRDHEKGGGAGLRKLDFFRFGLFFNSSATDIVFVTLPSTAVETAIAQCTSRCAMARGHRLNTSIVMAPVHRFSGLFRAVSAASLHSFVPPSPPTPRLRP